MSTRSDRLALLEQLRPSSVVETAWPAPDRDAAFARILEATRTAPELPEAPRTPGQPRRRRMLVAAAVSAVLIPSGVGVAAAEGMLSAALVRDLSWWTSETDGSVDVRDARRVAQGPGPDATRVLTVWSATGRDGTTCTSAMFEAPGALDRPADGTPAFASGSCPSADQQARATFGDLGGSADEQGVHTMITPAGRAVQAELRLPDGTVRAALATGRDFAFWYRADRTTPAPVLVGRDGAGHVVDRVPLPNLLTGTP